MKKIILSFMFVCIGASLSFAQPQLERHSDGLWIYTTKSGMVLKLPGEFSRGRIEAIIGNMNQSAQEIGKAIINEMGKDEVSPESKDMCRALNEMHRAGSLEEYNLAVNSAFKALMNIVCREIVTEELPLIEVEPGGRCVRMMQPDSHT